MQTKYDILYVDDEPSNLRVFKALFGRYYNIHTAESGLIGIEILEKIPIKLIITDQRMPIMTGVEFLKLAKKKCPNIQSILLTAYSDHEPTKEAINVAGIYKYINKPLDHNNVKAIIDQAMEIHVEKEEKKRITELLKETQQLAHVGSWTWDIDSDELEWSDEIYKINGVKKNDFTPTNQFFLDNIHSDDLERVKQLNDDLINNGGKIEFDYKYVRKDGENLVLRNWNSMVENTGDGSGIMIGATMDVTVEKEKEEALKKSFKRATLLSDILSFSSIPSITVNAIEKVCNDTIERLCKHANWPLAHVYFYEKDAKLLTSSKIWYSEDSINKEALEKFKEITEKTNFKMGTGLPGSVWKNEKTVWITDIGNEPNFPRIKQAKELGIKGAFAFPIAANNELVAIMEFYSSAVEPLNKNLIAISEEIGKLLSIFFERVRAEKNIVESEEKFRTFTESSKVAILVLKDKRFFYSNKEAMELLEFTQEELQSKIYTDVVHPDYIHLVNEKSKGVLDKASSSTRFELQIISKSGIVKDLDLFIARIHLQGEPAVLISAMDISIQKVMTHKIKQSIALLESKNKELEQFAFIASHDLQEPLSTISSFVELLDNEYNDMLDGNANVYLNFIIQSTGRMKRLIKGLLEYSRISGEKKSEVVNANNILKEIIVDLQGAIQEKNAKIESEQLPKLRAFPIELKQLFQNLISNALKYSRQNVTPLISISAKKQVDGWLFSVKDNGIGLEEKFKERIFVIFQRLHNKNDYDGTGIGLALCRKIVELHKGKIWVESIPNEGSTFLFTIKTI